MIVRIKNICIVFVIITGVILFYLVPQIMALEPETHSAINKYIAKGAFLDDYLKNQLGMSDGKDTFFNNKKVFDLISDGGIFEDKPSWCFPYWRSRNHFHNPIDNSGFSGWWDTGIMSGMSVLDWINQPVNTQSCGYYSWNDAHYYFEQALTAKDKAARETNYANTFRAIGQSMHLIQDMSVPEHTRIDGHYFFYDYEVWALGLKVSDYAPQLFIPNDTFPLSINNLFDTNQYNGTNPDSTTQLAIGLAEYSNANFLSPDSIFKGFIYPNYSSTETNIDTSTGKNILYLKKVGNGENIEHFARANNFYNYLPVDYKKLALTLDDPKVYGNYAAKLIPRAIGYSSQVLSYFFRGQLEAEFVEGNLKIKNTSAETISGGTFSLYYDNANEERNLLVTAQANTLDPGGEQTIPFNPPPEGVVSYMLLYKGKLGSEPEAVIGKFIPTELVVFTVSLSGISGENLTKKSVLVWNPASNSLVRAPLDYADTDFQKWYKDKTDIGKPLFSSFAHDIYNPHKLAPELIDITNMDYHADGSLSYYIFPETIYANVLLPPQNAIIYAGLRTSVRTIAENFATTHYMMMSITVTENGSTSAVWYEDTPYNSPPPVWQEPHVTDYGPFYPPGTYYFEPNPMYYQGTTNGEDNYEFYGILGKYSGEFKGTTNGYSKRDAMLFETHETNLFIPRWHASQSRNPSWSDDEWFAKSREWYDSDIGGKYSDKTIATVCIIQYTPYTTIRDYLYYQGVDKTTWSPSGKTILAQAQALYVLQGTTGYDWVAKGRNENLEGKIIEAVNMAYSLNGISANEIREISINIEIVK